MSTELFPEAEMSNSQLATIETTPMSLIAAAIEKGLDPGKLYDLQERWEAARAKEAYAAAMTAAQGEMRPVVRSRENKQQGSMYAALEDIHDVIKPIWLKHGFTLSYSGDKAEKEGDCRVVCDCLHSGGHTTHHYLDGPPDEKGIKGNPNKTPIQAVISTGTYLRRALAVMIFDITIVGADRDGQRPFDTAKVSDEQCLQMQAFLDEHNLDPRPFLKFKEVEKLGDILASDFDDCMMRLRNKAKEKAQHATR